MAKDSKKHANKTTYSSGSTTTSGSLTDSPSHSPTCHHPPLTLFRAGDIFSSEYGEEQTRITALLRDIRNAGRDLSFDTPRVVVIGGQSAGKSSLIEAIGGICVNRDTETCTKCPMEYNFSAASDSGWSCTISIRVSVSASGDEPVLQTKSFSPVLTDADNIEIWLRRAQAAILNPHLNVTTFHEKSESEVRVQDEKTLAYSPNTVVVDVQGPDVVDLCLVDLPGLHDTRDPIPYHLVSDYIQGDNTIIVVTIPMNNADDIENQPAFQMARVVDPDGERTICVLTKPDMISPGTKTRRWIDLLRNQSKEDELCYLVRLPNETERQRSSSNANFASDQCFEFTGLWRRLPDYMRMRCGMPNLVDGISSLLVKRIQNIFLPGVQKTVQDLIEECDRELSLLAPPVIVSPSTEVLQRVTSFCEAVRGSIILGKKKHIAAKRKRYQEFKNDIFATRPNFWPLPTTAAGAATNKPARSSASFDGPNEGTVVDLDVVKSFIADRTAWESDGYVPFEAVSTLSLDFINLWESLSLSLFNDIFTSTSESIAQLIKEHVGPYKRLESHVREVVKTELEGCKAETLRMLHKVLALERFPLFTLNSELFKTQETYWVTRYTDYYSKQTATHDKARKIIPRESPQQNTPGPTSAPTSGAAKTTSPPPLPLPPSSQDVPTKQEDLDALRVMATVRAYFDVAHKRIIDYIPLTIESELDEVVRDKLQKSLVQSLFDVNPNGSVLHGGAPAPERRIRDFLIEDQSVVRRRGVVLERKERLHAIRLALDRF